MNANLFSRQRKGQFILLFGIIILLALLLALPRQATLTVSGSRDLSAISENLVRELPRAFNFGINESAPVSRLANFSRFLQPVLSNHFINLSHIWFFTEVNTANNNLNISVGNFLERNVTVSLNLSGTIQNLTVNRNTTNNTIFNAVSTNPFNITIQAGADVSTVEWQRDKHNFFAFFTLKREKEFIRNEISS